MSYSIHANLLLNESYNKTENYTIKLTDAICEAFANEGVDVNGGIIEAVVRRTLRGSRISEGAWSGGNSFGTGSGSGSK